MHSPALKVFSSNPDWPQKNDFFLENPRKSGMLFLYVFGYPGMRIAKMRFF